MENYTRIEKFLDGILNNIPVPEPYTRVEMLLAAIAAKIGSGGGGGASSADDVSYDNTDSGLTATNVQDAIDEVAQSGGGEASNVALFSLQMVGQNKFRTVETAGQIKAMVDSGKALIGTLNVAEGMTAQLGVAYADFAGVSGPTKTLMLYSYDGGSGSLVPITLTASTDNDVFEN